MDKEYLISLVGEEAAEDIWQKHTGELAALRCGYAISGAVQRCGGRNERAIRALLDEAAIAAADDMEAAARQAVEKVKQENGFLFGLPQVSAPGTGSLSVDTGPTLAQLGKMSMAEYRRYRQGR